MDENSKHGGDDGQTKLTAENAVPENPNSATNASDVDAAVDVPIGAVETDAGRSSRQASSRTPFANLSQVDADLALARTLQEQERAYMMLSLNGNNGSYGGWEEEYYFDNENDDYDDPDGHAFDGINDDQENEYELDDNNDVNEVDGEGSTNNDDIEDSEFDDDEDDEDEDEDEDDDEDGDVDDASDVHDGTDSGESEPSGVEIDSAAFPDDEAYARALQDVEEREMSARLMAMAGIAEREVQDLEDQGGNSQGAWDEVDPDELSYEELIALGEVVGTESRGLSADTIASLPSINYKSEDIKDEEPGTCVVCRLEYEDGDTLTLLNCKHSYHSECISNWLKINKVCPVCSTEVSTS